MLTIARGGSIIQHSSKLEYSNTENFAMENGTEFETETERKTIIEEICFHADVIDAIRNLSGAYEFMVRPLFKQMGVTYTAFVILMYLSNNPDKQTASDICRVKGIKPNLISFSVEKLVQEGFLRREPMPRDRRSVRLVCTDRALPFIEKGREISRKFLYDLTEGLSGEDVAQFIKYSDKMRENAVKMREKPAEEKI